MEGVESPVVETLKKQKEPEDSSNSKRRCEEPTGLTKRIHQEYRNEYCDGTRECDCVIRTDTYKTGNLKLTKHKPYKSEGSVECHKRPESPKLAPPDEIPLSLRTPEQKKRMTHSVCWSTNCRSKKVCTLKIGTCQPVSIPTRNESCPSKPTTKSKVSSGKKKKSRPANKNETVSLKPVVEYIEPSPLLNWF
jgi:hypothetical protein